jgi:hypothetical protein
MDIVILNQPASENITLYKSALDLVILNRTSEVVILNKPALEVVALNKPALDTIILPVYVDVRGNVFAMEQGGAFFESEDHTTEFKPES